MIFPSINPNHCQPLKPPSNFEQCRTNLFQSTTPTATDSAAHTRCKTASAPNPNAQIHAPHAKRPNRGYRPVSSAANCPSCQSDCFGCKALGPTIPATPPELRYQTATNTLATSLHYRPHGCYTSAASPNCAKPLRSHCCHTTRPNSGDCLTASTAPTPPTPPLPGNWVHRDTSFH